ncbi:hypothetical protein HBI81_124100 [Parastagonospora nodorum]|nr:hypothetical protein HBI75_133870 [Parastagonospora nodorum]KAH5329656.1 hypothetical protein HBI12_066410 [Parastagonospora nodorum]KAH5363801.1 hypothetical protein HBI49_113810 [Parastagonospora nodorum]KAH5651627.1 hypothetical protein HBI23_166840 [Parastagonospora nodorum]KAH5779367.1 hypothetical protein HBI16_065750 [Parastagonospora nodorum]
MLRPIRYEDDHARGGSGAYAPILKLGDWGRVNVNALTGHGSHRTLYRGDWPYHPSESEEDNSGQTSRPYDIWSIGCLYLDLLAWFTGGKAGYKDFGEARKASLTPWTKTRASTSKS